MNKECIFRCRFGGQGYSIYAEPHPKREGEWIYWTYVGRRKFDIFSWASFEGAIGSILCVCEDFDVHTFGKVWL